MIKVVNINNFKCFLSQQVKFNDITVLAGINGVGKSTVIQSLLLLRKSIERISFSSISVGGHISLNEEYQLRLGNANEVISSNAKDNIISFEIGNDQGTYKFDFEAKSESLGLDLVAVSPPDIVLSEFSLGSEEFHYINAERLGPRNVQDVVDQSFISVGCQGEYTGQAIARAAAENKTLSNEDKRRFLEQDAESLSPIVKQIELWVDYIIPGIQLSVESFPKINTVRTSLRKESSGTDFLHPYNIGFGITYLLPIVVSGLLAKPGSTLIVENPEAHLHPKGQSRIGQFLAHIASAGIQVVIETHSEHVINGIRIASLKRVLNPDQVTINFFSQDEKTAAPKIEEIEVQESGELTKWPKGFLDQEEEDLAELFRLRKP